MIHNTDQFVKVLKDLLAYYHKPANDTAIAIWLSSCSKVMNDEQFYQAVTLCFEEKSQLPPINEFIALIAGDSKALEELSIAQAWDAIIEGSAIASSTRPEHITRRQEILANLTAAQFKALHQLGGFSRLGQVSTDDLVWRRKNFLEMCKIYKEGEKATQKAFKPSHSSLELSSGNGSMTKIGDALF